VEAEGFIEGAVVDEDGEEGEDVEEVDLELLILDTTSNTCAIRPQIHTCEMPKSLVVWPSFQ
jgi:hypothetical protein